MNLAMINTEKLKAELRAHPLFLKERHDINQRSPKKIGYEHNLDQHPLPSGWKAPITFEQAESLLGMDARRIDEECDQRLSEWVKRDDARQMATAIMVYSLGIDAVCRMVAMNQFVRQELFEKAALKVEESAFARDEPDIAKRVAELMRSKRA